MSAPQFCQVCNENLYDYVLTDFDNLAACSWCADKLNKDRAKDKINDRRAAIAATARKRAKVREGTGR